MVVKTADLTPTGRGFESRRRRLASALWTGQETNTRCDQRGRKAGPSGGIKSVHAMARPQPSW